MGGTNSLVVAGASTLRYAITDLCAQTLDNPAVRETHLRAQIRAWAVDGVHIVQLREKQLRSGELLRLAQAAVGELERLGAEGSGRNTCRRQPLFLINGRPDLALAARADGVHLTARPGELTPAQVRQLFHAAHRPHCVISISCHTLEEVEAARNGGADFLLFGPVFEKRVGGERVVEGTGLPLLRQACALGAPTPVLALGGVTLERVSSCLEAGAAGFAGIRPFAGNRMEQ